MTRWKKPRALIRRHVWFQEMGHRRSRTADLCRAPAACPLDWRMTASHGWRGKGMQPSTIATNSGRGGLVCLVVLRHRAPLASYKAYHRPNICRSGVPLVYSWYTVGMGVGMRHRDLMYEIPYQTPASYQQAYNPPPPPPLPPSQFVMIHSHLQDLKCLNDQPLAQAVCQFMVLVLAMA